ncbi:hypothetical protein EGW08_011388 [Elysia chlorotica]|uniref:Uncharacterized protein n=1 Tax=Elysia chlorotica TaxID=188477 RepID=A0A3S1A2B4_ELYCH|nr:hypothetical protein EGW08_011388 [Elysia chlorotica]
MFSALRESSEVKMEHPIRTMTCRTERSPNRPQGTVKASLTGFLTARFTDRVAYLHDGLDRSAISPDLTPVAEGACGTATDISPDLTPVAAGACGTATGVPRAASPILSYRVLYGPDSADISPDLTPVAEGACGTATGVLSPTSPISSYRVLYGLGSADISPDLTPVAEGACGTATGVPRAARPSVHCPAGRVSDPVIYATLPV